jgi:hypothetical protein
MSPSTSEWIPILIWVTPAQAAVWLQTADPGNKIFWPRVAELAAAMRDQSLHCRGAPVEFCQGRLVNGNHRLLALQRHGRPVRLLVLGQPPQKNNLTPNPTRA